MMRRTWKVPDLIRYPPRIAPAGSPMKTQVKAQSSKERSSNERTWMYGGMTNTIWKSGQYNRTRSELSRFAYDVEGRYHAKDLKQDLQVLDFEDRRDVYDWVGCYFRFEVHETAHQDWSGNQKRDLERVWPSEQVVSKSKRKEWCCHS